MIPILLPDGEPLAAGVAVFHGRFSGQLDFADTEAVLAAWSRA